MVVESLGIKLLIFEGSFAQLVSERFPKINYLAIDPSPEAITYAKDRKTSAKFLKEEFLLFKPTEKYDLILFTKSLHHILPVKEVM
jgi:trans-aconitate methyltransferase